MKNSWKSVLLALVILGPISLGAAPKVLYPVVVDGRSGFVSNSGELVINPQFDKADVFSEGQAAVRLDKWGYVDGAGKMTINPQFDKADAFSDGLAAVRIGGAPTPRRI